MHWPGRAEDHAPAALAVNARVTVPGAVRFAGPRVPFSGHMLFFTCAALTTRSSRFVLLMILALAAEATWFKLVPWRDARSWALGIAAGALLAEVRILIQRTSRDP